MSPAASQTTYLVTLQDRRQVAEHTMALAVNKHIACKGTTIMITASGTEQLRNWQG